MNRLTGKIVSIESCKDLSLVRIKCHSIILSSIIIETSSTVDYLKKDNEINVLFKETEVIISKQELKEISLQNQLPCKVIKINKGELLSSLKLEFNGEEIRSVITTNAVNNLALEENMNVVAMVKTNEMMLAN